ncbi:hypothetical protein J7444_06675 [Labrenzia sp. R4_1]|uniref:hypothetical protein n=1 Tax=Labrenzia sp. R4_1 TaxID=2821106 RepID=UPI001ADCDC20|nr:hypothetical protein [Labrenzia sp. R4_1]MBO9424396.1 hypothetical protein [Labrenzia sp. R4_1]
METTYTEFDGSLGQFFQAYAAAEFALTCALLKLSGTPTTSGNLLVYGMSAKVKSKKLQLLIQEKHPNLRPYLAVIKFFDKTTEFRHKLAHWYYIYPKDRSVGKVNITDPFKDFDELFKPRITISAQELNDISEWLRYCAMFTSVKLQDDAEKSDIDDLASNLLRHSPRIPANLDTSLDTPF